MIGAVAGIFTGPAGGKPPSVFENQRFSILEILISKPPSP